jgi:hypothetical protein
VVMEQACGLNVALHHVAGKLVQYFIHTFPRHFGELNV